MAASDAQRFLAKNGVDDELALEMFSGWIAEAFHDKTFLWNTVGPEGVGSESLDGAVVSSKIVTSGKSEQFIQMSLEDGAPEYHTPGTELLGQTLEVDEGSITIDGILVGHYDLPVDQIQLAHFDILRPAARKIGRKLATDFEKKLIITGLKAAYTAASTKGTITMHNGGNAVERVAATEAAAWPVTTTGAQNMINDIGALAYAMDVDNVPEAGRFLMITPYLRRVLGMDLTIFDQAYSAQRSNDLNRRIIGHVQGFDILPPTNLLPSTDVQTGPTKYRQDFTAAGSDEGQPVALALCGADEGNSAIGYVAASNPELGPIYSYMGFDERRNTWFTKGQMMVGAGVLGPYCAGVIHVDSA